MLLPSFLFSPAELKRQHDAQRAHEKARFERNKHRAEVWDLWKTKPPRKLREPLVIKAETYDITHRLFDVKSTNKRLDSDPSTYRERDGRFRYYHFTTLPAMPLQIPVADRDNCPEVFFTAPVNIPVLLFKHQFDGWRPWMGMSPAEIFSQRGGVKFCRGNTVIGGLGLGWFLSEAVKLGKATRITVVEKDPDLLDWFGNDLCKKLGVDVVCDDIWNAVGKHPAGTRYAIDIWPDWFDAKYDQSLIKARADGHHIWAWDSPRGER